MHKNYFKISLSQEAGASGKSIEKEPQKSRQKLKKNVLNFSCEYFVCSQSNASGRFLQKCINFVEQRRILT